MDELVGTKVTLFCGIYIYTGTLKDVSALGDVGLDDAKLVYETGSLTEGDWKDAQDLPDGWRVMLSAIESFGPAKC